MPQDRVSLSDTALSPHAAPLVGGRSAGLDAITLERAW